VDNEHIFERSVSLSLPCSLVLPFVWRYYLVYFFTKTVVEVLSLVVPVSLTLEHSLVDELSALPSHLSPELNVLPNNSFNIATY
jgi:hypothetical protein